MCLNIDEILNGLSSKNDFHQQEHCLDLAQNIEHLSVLIMPIEDKLAWENCAKVLATKNDKELELYFIALLEWLKDMNWPGAYLIYDRLTYVQSQSFVLAYEYSLQIAKQTKDKPWEQALIDLFNVRQLKMKNTVDGSLCPPTQNDSKKT